MTCNIKNYSLMSLNVTITQPIRTIHVGQRQTGTLVVVNEMRGSRIFAKGGVQALLPENSSDNVVLFF